MHRSERRNQAEPLQHDWRVVVHGEARVAQPASVGRARSTQPSASGLPPFRVAVRQVPAGGKPLGDHRPAAEGADVHQAAVLDVADHEYFAVVDDHAVGHRECVPTRRPRQPGTPRRRRGPAARPRRPCGAGAGRISTTVRAPHRWARNCSAGIGCGSSRSARRRFDGNYHRRRRQGHDTPPIGRRSAKPRRRERRDRWGRRSRRTARVARSGTTGRTPGRAGCLRRLSPAAPGSGTVSAVHVPISSRSGGSDTSRCNSCQSSSAAAACEEWLYSSCSCSASPSSTRSRSTGVHHGVIRYSRSSRSSASATRSASTSCNASAGAPTVPLIATPTPSTSSVYQLVPKRSGGLTRVAGGPGGNGSRKPSGGVPLSASTVLSDVKYRATYARTSSIVNSLLATAGQRISPGPDRPSRRPRQRRPRVAAAGCPHGLVQQPVNRIVLLGHVVQWQIGQRCTAVREVRRDAVRRAGRSNEGRYRARSAVVLITVDRVEGKIDDQ